MVTIARLVFSPPPALNVRKCEKVYMEDYTSLLSFGLASDDTSSLEKLYEKTITVAEQEMVEEKAD
uniref:Uncharacterized protein n=1 Tax=Cucumis melo TaxID=3656 RepID=A0A9I9EG59_CUCME